MKAVVHYALEPCSVELREIAEPTPRAGEAIVRVRAVGVCGSDLHQYHNTQSWQVNVPVVLGHEFAGVIEAVGDGVQGWQVGDRVACETAAVICERCAYCRTGRYNLCPQRLGFGYGVNGAMTRYVRAPARILHRLPDTLSFEDAAMTEPCCVAAHAVIECSQPKPGDLVVVFGSGPIGLLCLQMAKLFSPRKAILVGLSTDGARLQVAEAVGAGAILCADRDDIEAIIRREGDGLGADLVIDAVGSSAVLEPCLRIARPDGQITKVGWGPEPLGYSLDPLVGKNLRLQGTFSHTWGTWERVLTLMGAGRLKLAPMRRAFTLEAWRDAFQAMEQRRTVKSVLIPE
ncbi:MAG: zinc-binding dehydrogenase [Fimbriimonadales bacterium]|nr:MAG: Zn-dependent alcohol dehydrogenase [Fimbriimonadales bacterium]